MNLKTDIQRLLTFITRTLEKASNLRRGHMLQSKHYLILAAVVLASCAGPQTMPQTSPTSQPDFVEISPPAPITINQIGGSPDEAATGTYVTSEDLKGLFALRDTSVYYRGIDGQNGIGWYSNSATLGGATSHIVIHDLQYTSKCLRLFFNAATDIISNDAPCNSTPKLADQYDIFFYAGYGIQVYADLDSANGGVRVLQDIFSVSSSTNLDLADIRETDIGVDGGSAVCDLTRSKSAFEVRACLTKIDGARTERLPVPHIYGFVNCFSEKEVARLKAASSYLAAYAPRFIPTVRHNRP